MRALAILALVTSMAAIPGAAESAPGSRMTVGTGDWAGVPSIPLRPPVVMQPGAREGRLGNWSRNGGWRGWGMHRAPGKFIGHFRPRPGIFIPRFFVSPTFVIYNWRNFGLGPPGYGRRWVRHYGDAALIDDRGYIYDVAHDVDWDGYSYADRPDHQDWYEGWDGGWGTRVYHVLPGGPAVYQVPPGSTTVIVQSTPVVTKTITTTYVDEVVAAPRRRTKRR